MAKPAQALRIARLRWTRNSGSVGSGGVVLSVSRGVAGGGGFSGADVLSDMAGPLQGGKSGRTRQELPNTPGDGRHGHGRAPSGATGSVAGSRVLVGVEDPSGSGGEVGPRAGEDVDQVVGPPPDALRGVHGRRRDDRHRRAGDLRVVLRAPGAAVGAPRGLDVVHVGAGDDQAGLLEVVVEV